MKKMRKTFALLIAMLMLLGMSTNVFAATITVENAYQDETYDAYKILEYTSNKTTTVDPGTGAETIVPPTAYSYYLPAAAYNGALGALLREAGFSFTESADHTQWYVKNANRFTDGKVLADYLYQHLDTLKTCALAKNEGNTGNAEGKVVLEDLTQGYWFVTSSVGSLCTLQSFDDQALVVEKNELITTPSKTASDTEFQVGDTITYTITYTDVDGTNNELILRDTMTNGLTYKADTLKVKIKGVETADSSTTGEGSDAVTVTNYTVTPMADTAGAVLTITVSAKVMETLKKGETIVVTYDVLVNNNASLDGTEKNTIVARTSEQETAPKVVVTESMDLTVNKTDGISALKGAQFELYRTTAADGTPCHEIVKLRQLTAAEILLALGKDGEDQQIQPAADTVYYVVDTSSANTTIDMAQKDGNDKYLYSSARIFGLDKDSTYGLLETKAPEGFNKLNEEKAVSAGLNTINVANQKGTVLPSTGGMGTTLFYILGAVLVLGAGIVLVTRRRMNVQ